MNVTGIIAEYNPFHTGHLYQINYIKKQLHSDYIIVAMSGDYVQRGTPALLPKHLRAEMALLCGADLVLEIPVQFSSASAEFFAKGGVSLLDGLGVTDQLCFGSEEGSADGMQYAAQVFNEEPENYRILLQSHLKKGLSFPAARSKAFLEYIQQYTVPHPSISESLLSSPNNILGIEYCRALQEFHSDIKPVTLKRKGSDYHETELADQTLPSASAIRKYLVEKEYPRKEFASASENFYKLLSSKLQNMIPDPALTLFLEAFQNNEFITEKDLDLLLHYCLITTAPDSLTAYADVSADLADRIQNRLNHYKNFAQFTELLKTKELTRTRIQRALLHILLQITENPKTLSYGRVLGFRKESGPLLKEIKRKSRIPLLTKLSDAPKLLAPESLELLEKNTVASNLYESILCHRSGRDFKHEYQKQIRIL